MSRLTDLAEEVERYKKNLGGIKKSVETVSDELEAGDYVDLMDLVEFVDYEILGLLMRVRRLDEQNR